MTTADVVVAGAGHNSLITAAYLARAGYEVVVLDARAIPGGGAASEELLLPATGSTPARPATRSSRPTRCWSTTSSG